MLYHSKLFQLFFKINLYNSFLCFKFDKHLKLKIMKKFEKLHQAVHFAQKEILNQKEYNSATLCIKENGDIYFIGLEYKNVIVCPGSFDFDSHYFKVVLSDIPNHCVANCSFGYDTMSFICKNNLQSIFI